MAIRAVSKVDLERARAALATRYPTLHVVHDAASLVLRGSIAIDHDGRELDRFMVEIERTSLEDGTLPDVRETAGRIPREADRHVNGDGTCCVCLPEDYFLRHPGPFDLLAFLDGPVRNFFIAQALVERGEGWPQGEWRHGDAGLADWFREFCASLTPDMASEYLALVGMRELKGHHLCPCGSGLRIRHCHLSLLRRLREGATSPALRELRRKLAKRR